MCPSADRTKTVSGNQSTFLMTNMQPQLHELNAGPWEKLEEFEREMAKRPNAELYILAGGIFSPSFVTVGHNVAVPKSNYKIVVELSRGEGPKDVTPQTPVVAVIMPNRLGVGQHEWTDFLVSVDEIERKTGYEFLSKLPDAVQRTIEAKVGAPPAP
jgi:endonuclease G